MYGLYQINETKTKINYKLIEEISIFGCNSGFIPWLLKFNISNSTKEPYKWHLNIKNELYKHKEYKNTCIVIDFKPNNKIDDYILIGELTDVWGYSDSGWTPLLFRVNMIFVDIESNSINKSKFSKSINEIIDVVYTYLYAKGSIDSGELIGTWNAPSLSPTNSVLLWPDTLNYFHSEIIKYDSEIMK